jgi:uncharacterized protein
MKGHGMPLTQKSKSTNALKAKKRAVIAGGTGFIGQHLAAELSKQGYEVIVLSRQTNSEQKKNPWQTVLWDGANPGDWIQYIDGAYAMVNLAGKNVNCRYTQNNLNVVDMSRVRAVTAIAKAINRGRCAGRLQSFGKETR